MKIGLIREEKTPYDHRVALLPEHCVQLRNLYPMVQLMVQPSPHRCVSDDAYVEAGCIVKEDLSTCEVLLGIKEVPITSLIPHKTYLFFSHTIKKQKYNRGLLQSILDKKITLIDYESLTSADGQRMIAFGRYAGIVGAYNAFWTYGKKYGLYEIKRAYQCRDRAEMAGEYANIQLPPIKIALTGSGRVGQGALEVLNEIGIRQVNAQAFQEQSFQEPVFSLLRSEDYHTHKQHQIWDASDFYRNPGQYTSTFKAYTKVADILIAATYWNPQAPVLFTKEDMQEETFQIRVVADITCDIDGSIPCTVRPSIIQDPVYDFDRFTGEVKTAFSDPDHISVMAIDNLPCELPLDASAYFGEQFIRHILPCLLEPEKDHTQMISRATVASGGQLTTRFSYLDSFVKDGI